MNSLYNQPTTEFIHSLYLSSLYRRCSLSLEVDLFDACISLNKKSLLTINSQPFKKNASEHRNSYVEFYAENASLYERLKSDPRIFTSYTHQNKTTDNFPSATFELHREIVHPRLIIHYARYYRWPDLPYETPVHAPWMKKLYYFIVVANNELADNTQSAPEIILEII